MPPPSSRAPVSVLFVCMGNICRSPIAEGVFLHVLRQRGLEDRCHVDSAGTGDWHAGERPDHRAIETAERHGIHLPSVARAVTRDDFDRFDHLICMDRLNARELLARGAPPKKVRLLLDFDQTIGHDELPDPYYGDVAGFELVFTLCERACTAVADRLFDRTASR
ncbi:MAG: low molecular weight protein-tyrosine-phosphatase [Phycisphaerales bacterium]|jgi:protein-tyrosine phosphatase